jgi:leucine dehydrogenase
MEITTLKRDGFEEIAACCDRASGLTALIAIHSTRLGPALGGIRMHPYAGEDAALEDVCRLAEAMTFKAAAAHLKLGGGKAVILGHPARDKTPGKLRAMGRFINTLGGRYLAAKDAGIVTEDLIEVARETRHVTGLPESMGGSGDPSPWTAKGILGGLEACLAVEFGDRSPAGRTVAVQGLGHVGYELARLLHERKAHLIVADPRGEVTAKAAAEFRARVTGVEEIYAAEADIFAPCALGGILNDETLGRLKCRIVAGGANNQLLDEKKHGGALFKKGILYAPDYIINAGGLINIYAREILKAPDPMPWIDKIGGHLERLFKNSRVRGLPPAEIALEETARLIEAG